MTPSELKVDADVSTEQCALRVTREAIARWTSGKLHDGRLQPDRAHESLQARHLAKARRDLAAWLAHGGFAQETEAAAPTGPATHEGADVRVRVNACMG